MIFTDAFINRSILNCCNPIFYQDDRLPCLRCRVTPNGASFYFVGTVQGVRVRKQLGRYPFISIASARAAVWQFMIESSKPKAVINSPAADTSNTDKITFAALLDLYLSYKKSLSPKTVRWYKVHLSSLGIDDRDCLSVTPKDFLAIFEVVHDRSPSVAKHGAKAVKTIIKWYAAYTGIALDDPTRLVNPLAGIAIHSSNARTRRLSADDLPTFWQVLKGRHSLERDAITFCLLTAMRKNEVLGLTRDNITVNNSAYFVTLQTTKNGKPHKLPLVGVALEVVKRRMSESTDGRLFPTQGKHAFDALKSAGVVISWHDLRRSWASFAVSNGVSDAMVKRVLNHSPDSVTSRHYAFFDDASIADALLKVERVICADFC
jgi:integrase